MLCQYTDLPIKMMTMMTTMIMIMKMLKWIIIWSQVCDSLHNHNLLLRENHGQTKVFASLSSSSSSSWSDSGIRNIIIIITFYFWISVILYFLYFCTFVLLYFWVSVFLFQAALSRRQTGNQAIYQSSPSMSLSFIIQITYSQKAIGKMLAKCLHSHWKIFRKSA